MTYAGDLTPQQAYELVASRPDVLLVDVRTRGEWQQIGVPDGADAAGDVAFVEWNTATGPNDRFLDDLAAAGATPERTLVFLCRSGVRSIGAAEAATAAGLGPAYNVLEGFEGEQDRFGMRTVNGWRNAGLPTSGPT